MGNSRNRILAPSGVSGGNVTLLLRKAIETANNSPGQLASGILFKQFPDDTVERDVNAFTKVSLCFRKEYRSMLWLFYSNMLPLLHFDVFYHTLLCHDVTGGPSGREKIAQSLIGMELDLAEVPPETSFKELRQEYSRQHIAVIQAVYTKSPYGDIFAQAAGDWAAHEFIRARVSTRVRKHRSEAEDEELDFRESRSRSSEEL